MATIERWANFDSTERYRYCLGRRWSPAPTLAIIMLNPSRADGSVDDPTIRRCMGLAQGWGFGAIAVVNLFAYRSPHPRDLRLVDDPVGPENDAALAETAHQAEHILLAWGNGGHWQGRDRTVLNLLAPHWKRCHCLGRNRTGHPRHPLYVPRGSALQPWTVPSTPAALALGKPRRPPAPPAQNQTDGPTKPPSDGSGIYQK